MGDPRENEDEELMEGLARLRDARELEFLETGEEREWRRRALDDLGADLRRRERLRRGGWLGMGLVAAAALLLSILAHDPGERTGAGRSYEDLARRVELPASFPARPADLENPFGGEREALRSESGPGPRIVAPLGATLEARPRIAFELGTFPLARLATVEVLLRDALGNEVATEPLACDDLCTTRPAADLAPGEWILSVRSTEREIAWSSTSRFRVRDRIEVEARLEELEPTGHAILDAQRAAAVLLDLGLAELALDELASAPASEPEARRRSLLLESRAARSLGRDERIAELRAEWSRLHAGREENPEEPR